MLKGWSLVGWAGQGRTDTLLEGESLERRSLKGGGEEPAQGKETSVGGGVWEGAGMWGLKGVRAPSQLPPPHPPRTASGVKSPQP